MAKEGPPILCSTHNIGLALGLGQCLVIDLVTGLATVWSLDPVLATGLDTSLGTGLVPDQVTGHWSGHWSDH